MSRHLYADPRRLDAAEVIRLELTDRDNPRLKLHQAAKRDDALRRNIVPRLPGHLAALRAPESAPRIILAHIEMTGLVEERRGRGWRRTALGDEVLAVAGKDGDT